MKPTSLNFLALCRRYILLTSLILLLANTAIYAFSPGPYEATLLRSRVVIINSVLVALMLPLLYRRSLVYSSDRRTAFCVLGLALISVLMLIFATQGQSDFALFHPNSYSQGLPRVIFNIVVFNIGCLCYGLIVLSLSYLISRPREKAKTTKSPIIS